MRAILIKCQEKGVKVDNSDDVVVFTEIKNYFCRAHAIPALEGADIIDMVSAISSAIDDLSDGAEMV